jgi:hypothetical protein
MVMKIQDKVLCVVTPCSVVAGYQRFQLRPEDGGSMVPYYINKRRHHPEELDFNTSRIPKCQIHHTNEIISKTYQWPLHFKILPHVLVFHIYKMFIIVDNILFSMLM